MASSLDQISKAYPVKAKAEITALTQLTKGFTVLEKNQEAKLKGVQPFSTIEGQFRTDSELSQTLVSLVKYVGNSSRP